MNIQRKKCIHSIVVICDSRDSQTNWYAFYFQHQRKVTAFRMDFSIFHSHSLLLLLLLLLLECQCSSFQRHFSKRQRWRKKSEYNYSQSLTHLHKTKKVEFLFNNGVPDTKSIEPQEQAPKIAHSRTQTKSTKTNQNNNNNNHKNQVRRRRRSENFLAWKQMWKKIERPLLQHQRHRKK